MSKPLNPAALSVHDPQWIIDASVKLEEIRDRLGDLPGAADARFDHIGSTSIPGLDAKPIIDLQVRLLPLPSDAALVSRLVPLGYRRATGSRPDSPGVYRDLPRGSANVDQQVWTKSLFVDADATVIVHVRRTDSPWADHTVWFRDWLIAHAAQRARYEAVKRELSAQQVGKSDYDDYTRAKTAFFDEVQAEFESWANR